MLDFGKRLKNMRKNKNWTQAQLAEMLHLTKSVISAYELGSRMPSYEVLIDISKIFKVSTDYLLGVYNRQEVDFSGLTDEEVTAILNLIKVMKH